ncbi:MAG: helix-turn-helix transcriptional regulator [Bacteroidales bacterium]|nr:helix-turn-helix transcriptional regulator [Bacteroidales bacterium]
MKDRIIQFLRENNLTSTKFADVIGVQRSSISHILSGRNKPSFDFIEKMLIAYPDLDAQWLITGKGDMNSPQPSLFNHNKTEENCENLTQRESNIQFSSTIGHEISGSQNIIPKIESSNNNSRNLEKEIDRVMIFYSDGTFKDYKSE